MPTLIGSVIYDDRLVVQESTLSGDAHGLGAILDAQFPEDVRHVELDGVDAQR